MGATYQTDARYESIGYILFNCESIYWILNFLPRVLKLIVYLIKNIVYLIN